MFDTCSVAEAVSPLAVLAGGLVGTLQTSGRARSAGVKVVFEELLSTVDTSG